MATNRDRDVPNRPERDVAKLLAPFDLAALDRDPATICAIDRMFRIVYVNEAWRAFGRENGAPEDETRWAVGAHVLDTTPLVLRPFYDALYAKVERTGMPAEHTYACHAPTIDRTFHMRVLPCAHALLVTSSLVVASEHPEPDAAPVTTSYEDAYGIVSQCAHCRRVRRATERAEWDWVPAFVARPSPNTSHGLCDLCVAFYFP